MPGIRMRARRRFVFASTVCFVAACGSRTGLLVPASSSEDNVADALPPLDVQPPPDTYVNDCPDAGSTLVYVITEQNDLYSFSPPSSAFRLIGTIACPARAGGATPFSMAVNRAGVAYVVFDDGELFRVSTATAACEATTFAPGQEGFSATFGMSFSTDEADGGDVLYVAGNTQNSGAPAQLATIDVTNYRLSVVGDFTPQIQAAELTGTGAGGLFGFWAPDGPSVAPSAIVQIDKATAQVTNSSTLANVVQGNGWAFGFWGGDFYTFTGPSASTTIVTRYSPNDGSITQVATLDELVVGAGVSTCAPQQ